MKLSSLGGGSFVGTVDFVPSPRSGAKVAPSSSTTTTTRRPKLVEMMIVKEKPVFKRYLSSFLRVADLDMTEMDQQQTAEDATDAESECSYPNYNYAAIDPPPGVEVDHQERWICIDDGNGSAAPIAPIAIRALRQSALSLTRNEDIWTRTKGNATVDVWTGTFPHSDLPAVRACGHINMSAKQLFDLLVDSSRVTEYNKLSMGREDILMLQETLEDGVFDGITKVMKAKTKFLRKTFCFTSLMHAYKLEAESSSGCCYVICTRAVHGKDSCLLNEILLGVNLIEECDDDSCKLTTVAHIRSPVPLSIAKRMGLAAAISFVSDLQKL